MSAPAAISGDFATYKHVQGRKMLQLVIEVPAEMASVVFASLGTPGSGEAIPVALARLVADAQPSTKAEPTKERRSFTDLPYAQQAAMRCNELDFQLYVASVAPRAWTSLMAPSEGRAPADAAAQLVRDWCRVESRADIQKGTQAGEKWERIEGEFYAHQHGRRA